MKWLQLSIQMMKYNARIIFGNKLVYFLIAAILIFMAIAVGNLFAGETFEEDGTFSLLLFIGALLIFYPVTFGIQNDKDARTLEIIFGIPDYRYRVWLMRMVMIVAMSIVMLFLLGSLLRISLIEYGVFHMVIQVLFPLIFLGMLAFFVSTIVKSGNGTAVIMIILGIILLISADFFSSKYYNIFFNPYSIPNGTTQAVWENLTFKNHLFLSIGTLVFLLGGLFNLQHREKFLG